MKRNNKKGFTIVELVIVIAVIGILAGILIPTFSGVTSSAKTQAALSSAKAAYTDYAAEHYDDSNFAEVIYVKVDGKWYKVEGGVAEVATSQEDSSYTVIVCPNTEAHETISDVYTLAPADNDD